MPSPIEYRTDGGKAALRADLRTARASLTPTDRADQAESLGRVVLDFLLAEHAQRASGAGPDGCAAATTRGTIAAFIGKDPEPDTAPLLQVLHSAGFDVVVPVCEPGHALSWAAWSPGVPLVRSARAPVDEPTGPRRAITDVRDVELVLVPALGVDRAGNRMGQGGGYYDRFFAHQPPGSGGNARAMAIVFRSELLEEGVIPIGPLDQKLSGAFTADGPLLFGVPLPLL